MKIERVLFKVSISDFLLLSASMLLIFNALVFVFSQVTGNSGVFLYEGSWVLQVVFPFGFGLIQSALNRNGVLKLSGYSDLTSLKKHIETLILKKGYVATESQAGEIKYIKKRLWDRFFNIFFRENINIKITENEVLIYSKRNVIYYIEMALKSNKK